MSDEKTTFHRTVISQLEDEYTDKGEGRTGYAVYELMSTINRCDGTMRRSAQAIRDRLAEMERNLDGGFTVYQVHLSTPTTDMTEAVAKRELAFTTLAALIGPEKIKELLDASRARQNKP